MNPFDNFTRAVGAVMPSDALSVSIERHIEDRACGRVRDLHVVCSDGRIILQGRCRTYHAKQLAQEAALDFVDARSVMVNEIVVG